MRVVSWNVNSLRTTALELERVYGSMLGFLNFLKADILCFQETKIGEDKLEKALARPDGIEPFWSFCKLRGGYSGVATFARQGLTWASCSKLMEEEEFDNEGRVVATDHGDFYVVNVYIPNGGDRDNGRPRLDYKLRFLSCLLDKLKQLKDGSIVISQSGEIERCSEEGVEKKGKPIVFCGDMNIALSPKDVYMLTSDPYFSYSREEIQWMKSVINELEMVDSHRCFFPIPSCSGLVDGREPPSLAGDNFLKYSSLVPPIPSSFDTPPQESQFTTASKWAGVEEGRCLNKPDMQDGEGEGFNRCFCCVKQIWLDKDKIALNGRRYTCWDTRTEARSRNEGVRIDYVFVSRSLPLAMAGVLDTRRAWSDHVAVYCDLLERQWVEGDELKDACVVRLALAEAEQPKTSSRKWKKYSDEQSIKSFFMKGSQQATKSAAKNGSDSKETSVPAVQKDEKEKEEKGEANADSVTTAPVRTASDSPRMPVLQSQAGSDKSKKSKSGEKRKAEKGRKGGASKRTPPTMGHKGIDNFFSRQTTGN